MTRVIEFKDKVVVITGAGGVLCGYLAKEFANTDTKPKIDDIIES
ncbi:D-mannonate oxidoreductase [Streptococcus suis]|nr:D-mannonate oxidoreductase [Streptococcus suis]